MRVLYCSLEQERLPGALTVILLILCTALEDRVLQTELAGYADYARQVRHRLLAGIW